MPTIDVPEHDETADDETADVRPSAPSSPELDSRYGRTKATTTRSRWIGWAVAASFVVVFGAWALWGGLLSDSADLEAHEVAHVIVSDSIVRVDYEVTAAPGTLVSCAVEAKNSGFAIVGWKIVDLPASEQRTRSLTEEVRTSEQAVTGLIYRCWLT